MLDSDLAVLYQVETKVLVQAVKRNIERFPADFMFQLTTEEFANLKSHFVTSSWGGRRTPPYVFTEQGVAMLSGVLRSKRATMVNIEIMRAFVRLREMLTSNKILDDKLRKLEQKYDQQFKVVFEELTEQGIVFENLKEAINKEMDIFDLICHTAFDQPPLTRLERVKNVKKRDYFAKYGEQARNVLEALLEKYADEGIENIEDMKILQVNPLDQFGSPLEIVELFGGKMQYQRALSELGNEIYKVA